MMLKKFFSTFICAVGFFPALGQYRIDSLKTLFTNTKDDSTAIVILCQISDEYALFNPDSAMIFAEKGFILANEKEIKKGQARSLTRIGNILKSIGNFPNALETHIKSLKISEEIDDKVGIAASYSNMAEIYKEHEQFQTALVHYFQAKEIFEKILKNLESKKNQDENLIKRNKKNLVITLLNIGDNYERMNLLDSALLFQSHAYKQAIIIDDNDDIGAILNNLGYIYFKKKKYKEALNNYMLCIPFLVSIDDKMFLANAYHGIAQVFQKNGIPDSSIYYAQKSLKSAEDGNFQKEVLNAATLLSQLYESRNDDKTALFYNKLAKKTSDSLFNLEKINQIQSLSINEKFRQLQIAEEKEKTMKERKVRLQNLAIVIFIITLFVTLFIISRRKTHPKAVELLGMLGLLLLFEFISIFLHPYIEKLTHHTPILILLVYVSIGAFLVPLHHQLNHWIKLKLAARHTKLSALQNKNETKNRK